MHERDGRDAQNITHSHLAQNEKKIVDILRNIKTPLLIPYFYISQRIV